MAKAKVDLSREAKEMMEELGNEVVEALRGQFFEVDGTPMATVKYENGSFKKKTLLAGWEFQLEYAYVGVQGNIQFGLSPEDAQEYKFVEMTPKELDYAFPLVGPAIAKHFGVDGENLKIVLDQLLVDRLDAQKVAEEKAKKEAEEKLGSLPTFGAF